MTQPENDPLLQRLAASDEAASLALLTHLCRQCPLLRSWLWGDFAHDETIRQTFASVVDDTAQPLPSRFIELTGEGQSWREEQQRLREAFPSRPYGGLSFGEVEALIRRYQAGTIDLGTFLLALDWREAGQASPTLVWAGVQFLDSLLPPRDWRLHTHLANAFTFLRRFGKKEKRRASFSPADWWKTHLLFYLLRNPRPAYRTRELRTHLASLGIEVSTKDIRRFCTRHGIRRDMRAGRPRKNAREAAAPSALPKTRATRANATRATPT